MNIFKNTPSSRPRYAVYGKDSIQDLVEAISFPRVFGTAENQEAMSVVVRQFQHIFGEDPNIQGHSNNVVMGDPSNCDFIVGAHYDSVEGTPGADDNASALGAMFRVAANTHQGDKICFVAFNGEECGLIGSREFVKDLGPKPIKQVHIFEMVGYRSYEPNSQKDPFNGLIEGFPTIGDFIGVICNKQHLLDSVIASCNSVDVQLIGMALPPLFSMKQIEMMMPHVLRSDHAPFWHKSIPAAMWTDTAEFRNERYHKHSDMPDTLDYDFISSVADCVIETIKGERTW